MAKFTNAEKEQQKEFQRLKANVNWAKSKQALANQAAHLAQRELAIHLTKYPQPNNEI